MISKERKEMRSQTLKPQIEIERKKRNPQIQIEPPLKRAKLNPQILAEFNWFSPHRNNALLLAQIQCFANVRHHSPRANVRHGLRLRQLQFSISSRSSSSTPPHSHSIAFQCMYMLITCLIFCFFPGFFRS